MKGSIIGDIVGAPFEMAKNKDINFEYAKERETFTDDTILTIATMKSILNGTSYKEEAYNLARIYHNYGYGAAFYNWFNSDNPEPYGSYGNGSAMRVSPIALAFETEDKVLEEAKKSAEYSHNHLEGIKGAQAIALCIFMAKEGKNKYVIKNRIEELFEYDLSKTLNEIRPDYNFSAACMFSVPESIICFLESTDYESAIRNAISLGGDADTMACMAGGISEVYYGEIPQHLEDRLNILPEEFKEVLTRFYEKYQKGN